MSKPDGGPAFPFDIQLDQQGGRKSTEGMTVRDYFAAAALHGLLTWDAVINQKHSPLVGEEGIEKTAQCVYMIADAMLAERDK